MRIETRSDSCTAPHAGGEMGERIWAFDWASTALGPMEGWPQSLRTAVQIALNSRYPMFVWWGPQLINFYNDAYIAVLGSKHPQALGQPARDVWAEIWTEIGPRVETVVSQGESTFDEDLYLLMDRCGYPEETYFTFSYSPILDEEGAVGGLFCACSESTSKVIGERRLKTLTLLSTQAVHRNDSLDIACQSLIDTLAGDDRDVPFACLFLGDGQAAQISGSYCTHPDLEPVMWPLLDSLRSQPGLARVEPLPQSFAVQAHFWRRPVQQAWVTALGANRLGGPNGLLVLGISPVRPFDTGYRDYFSLIAGQIDLTLAKAYEQERYRLVMKATHDGVWDYNLTTRRAIWDGQFYEMLGYEPHEVSSPGLDFILERVHPDDKATVITQWRHSLAQKSDYQAQYRLKHRQGHYITVLSKGMPVLDRQGNPLRMVGVITNITEEQRAAEAVRESEARFRAIADEAPVYIFIADADMKVTFFNKTWLTYTGLSFDVALGLSWQTITPQDDIELVTRNYSQAVANREPFTFEIRHRGCHGQYRWTLWQGIPRFMPDGRFLGFMGSGIDIHERKELEVALQQSEGHFRKVADKAPVMLWLTDENHHCTYLNQTWLDFTGQTLDEIQGFGWLEKIHPQDVQLARDAFMDAASQHTFFQVDYRLLRQDGVYRWTTDAGAPLFDGNGRFQGYIGYVVDITERKRAEEALQRSEERYRLIVEGSNDGIWDWVLDSDVVQSNKRYRDMMGITRDEVTVEEFFEHHLHPDDKLRIQEALAAHFNEDRPYDIEFRLRHEQTGDYSTVWSRGKVIRDEHGRPVRMAGLHTDLTERIKAEMVLAESEERFRTMADSAPVMIWQSDWSQGYFYFNQPWLEFTGRSPEQECGEGWLQGMHPQDLERYQQLVGNAFDTRQQYKIEYRLRRHDGQYRWLLDCGVPRFSPDQEFLGYIGSCIDIHERKQIEEYLQHAKQEAEEASKKKSEFLAMMSHELRTPLNAILGYSRMMETGMTGPISEKQAQYLGSVGASGQHLLTIINDLLDVSKIEAGKMDIVRQAIAVAPLLAEVESMMAGFARKKEVELLVRLAPDIGEIHVDPARFKQILVNLINNAIKFNQPAGKVTVDLNRRQDRLVVTVADTGIGMSQVELPQLFSKFYQVDTSASRRQEGTGLGLALTKDLIELHGGRISVESTQGQGSVFTFWLPIGGANPQGQAALPESVLL